MPLPQRVCLTLKLQHLTHTCERLLQLRPGVYKIHQYVARTPPTLPMGALLLMASPTCLPAMGRPVLGGTATRLASLCATRRRAAASRSREWGTLCLAAPVLLAPPPLQAGVVWLTQRWGGVGAALKVRVVQV
jgi:hypothetical protein